MDEIGFFNEREAECFEREDALSLSDLEKLNVNEDLPEMERTEHLLKNGVDKQKISILSSLPKILAANNSKGNLALILDCIKGVWQKCESEQNSSSAVLLEIFRGLSSLPCATVDGKVVSFPISAAYHDDYIQQMEKCNEEKKNAVFLLTEEQVTKLVVPLALDFVTEIQQKDFAEAASQAVIASLPRIGSALKKTQIIRVAIEKGDVSQTPGSRLICCFLLGAITAQNLLSPQDIEGLYFQKMMALCQDTDAEVRKSMCIHLDALARAVGEEKACSDLLPELLELLQDEEEQVKQSAFLAILSLLDFYPATERTKRVIPELISLAECLPEYIATSFAESFGPMVTKLATLNNLGTDISPVLLQSFSKLCAKEGVQLRQFCAYNFPAVVKAFGTAYIPHLMDDLLPKLSNDSDDHVRHHIAAGLHEVTSLLGQPRALRYIKPLLITMMQDDSPMVRGMAIARVPQIISHLLCPNDDDQKTALLDMTIKSIIQYHSILPASRNRDQLVFVETLGSFLSWFSSVQMYEMIIPILFDLIEDGARPVQLLAIQTLLKCIRRNDIASHRYSLLSKLRAEYGHSKSYWRRLLYLDACVFATSLNSRQYCRLNFIDIAIDLIDDPVPNVRLKAVSLVPLWKHVLSHLADDKMLERINQVLEENTLDSDRDVAYTMAEVRQSIDGNDIGRFLTPQPPSQPYSSPSHRRSHEDSEDKRKLNEEEALGMVSDHEDSSADARWSSMLEYTLVVGKDGQVVRRARVKSLDLVNKVTRSQGKDTGRDRSGNGSNGSSGGGGGNGGSMASNALSMGGGSGSSSVMALSMVLKNDGGGRGGKSATKASNSMGKPSPSLTTLPNCPTARPPSSAKTPQGLKVMGSTGKLGPSTSKTISGSVRSTSGLPKDSGVITKIPIIRPSAPAKRENSPSGGNKPSSTSLTPTPTAPPMSAPSSISGVSSGGSMGIKNRLGDLGGPSGGGGMLGPSVAMKPKAMAPPMGKR